MHIELTDLLLRLFLTVLLCGAIGVEREFSDQAAGSRTHILVGLGACLFTLVSSYGFNDYKGPHDPSRIAAQIVSGIGFLGAGAIMRQGYNIKGLTTAAALWIVAAIGMAVGAGFYTGAVTTTLFGLFALIIFRYLRRKYIMPKRSDRMFLEVEVNKAKTLSKIIVLLLDGDCEIIKVNSDKENGGEEMNASIEVRVPPGIMTEPITEKIRELAGTKQLQIY